MDPTDLYKDRRSHPRLEEPLQLDLLNMGDDPSVSPFEAVVPGTALDVSRQRVLSFTAAGALSATVMGGRLFFERDKVEVLRQHLVAGEAPPARTAKRGRSRA